MRDKTETLENVLNLYEFLSEGGELPAETKKWFARGWERYLAQTPGREFMSLDACLGLNGAAGKRRLPTTLALQKRNHHLRGAFDFCSGNIDQFMRAIRRFETCAWSRIKAGAKKPTDDLEKHLFAAFESGVTVPRSSRQIRKIVN